MSENFKESVISEIAQTITFCHVSKSVTPNGCITYEIKNSTGLTLMNIVQDINANNVTVFVSNRSVFFAPQTDKNALEFIKLLQQKLTEQENFEKIKQQIISEQENEGVLAFLRQNRV